MKTYTYIRKSSGGDPDQAVQQVLGTTDSKYIAGEVDELIRRRLTTKIKSSTNSQPVTVVKSKDPKIQVGTTYDSAREACRALGVGIQALSQAFYRGAKEADGTKLGTLKNVTFKSSKHGSI